MNEVTEALGINGPFLLSQVVNFLLLFLVLRVALWNPLLQRIDERRERLRQEREDAEAAAELRAEVEAKREEMLDEAREEAQQVVAKAQQEAEALKEQTIEEAGAQAEEIKDRARQEAEEERNRILGEMRGEIAALATAAAQRIIGESLDEQRQRALVNSFFSGVREGQVEVLPAEMGAVKGPVTVTSAIPLTDAEKDIIHEELRNRTGRDVDLSFKVNPEVLGGLILRAGDRVIDGSVVGQLERLQESLS